MSGGGNRHHPTTGSIRKGELTPQERELALKLRRIRMAWPDVGRAVGRSETDLRSKLDPTWRLG